MSALLEPESKLARDSRQEDEHTLSRAATPGVQSADGFLLRTPHRADLSDSERHRTRLWGIPENLIFIRQ